MIVKLHDFPANRFTTLRVQVAIHPTVRCLRAFYTLNTTDGDATGVRAFCASSQLNEDDPITAAVHFHRGELNLPIIIHEATHAMETVVAHMRLAPGTEVYSEVQAETVETVTQEVLKLCKKLKLKVDRDYPPA